MPDSVRNRVPETGQKQAKAGRIPDGIPDGPSGSTRRGRNREPLPYPLDSRLSPRQRLIVGLAWNGYSNIEISQRLGISECTVAMHLRIAREKTFGSLKRPAA
jgi:DNA-binding CsgD family transcriptional regulator